MIIQNCNVKLFVGLYAIHYIRNILNVCNIITIYTPFNFRGLSRISRLPNKLLSI